MITRTPRTPEGLLVAFRGTWEQAEAHGTVRANRESDTERAIDLLLHAFFAHPITCAT
jgi:hypothetical protein